MILLNYTMSLIPKLYVLPILEGYFLIINAFHQLKLRGAAVISLFIHTHEQTQL